MTDSAGESVELYVEDRGAGAPVVLLHGLGESTFTWRHLVGELAAGHRVIALDLMGHGRSDKPRDASYSADAQAALVAQVLAKLELRDVTLVGHSFGGTVALRTALQPGVRDAGRIARLIVISAPALPQSVAPYLDLVEIPVLTETVTASLPPEVMARILLREARGGATDISEEDIKGYAAPYYELPAKLAFLATARSIVGEIGRDAVAARYRRIAEPTLLVWCRRDPIVPLRAGKRLARTLPNARFAVLEGCHHLPQDERPQQLLEVMRPFLRS